MKQFGEIVKARRVAGMANAVLWECVDREAMEKWVPKPRFVPRRERKAEPESHHLMQVWGMRVVDIYLPYQRHSMNMDDSLEEAA
ncbi:EVE domain-containing protein [Cupriavidus respiraculi]|nr:EVE domain-containing protein [Cupriavidus respiraculi]